MNKAVKSQKLPALFVLICFLSGELFRPAGVMAAMPLPITEVAAAAAFQLELPPELGTVEMLVSGQGPTVIHIQEAHGDYESQLKIESILHFLKDRYGVDLLLLEGNAFKLHSELLNFFPGREDLNRSILEDLAKKNLASGPEFFLQKSPETQAWGIEDAGQYRENGQAFIHVLTQRTKTESFVNAMDLQIERLTSPYLNKDLRQYLKRLAGFEGGITPFEAWILELKDFSVKYLQKDITSPSLQLEWPMLVRLFVLKEFEKRLDLNAFQKERPAFLEVIKTIPDSVFAGVKSHLESSLSQSRLPDPDTSILFENMVAALPADFDYSRFPNVTLFIGHLILQSELKGERLFDEMTWLSDLVADKLAADPREKEITGLLKKHRLLKRLFSLELTAKDYEIFQHLSLRGVPAGNDEAISEIATVPGGPRNDNGLRPSAFIKQFEHLNSDKLVKDYQFEHMDEVDALYERALDFYQGAKERDGTMLQKIEERIETSGKNSAAVITGGFHAGPFKEFFESKGYNYALITPKMSRVAPQSHEAYVGSVLANYIAPLQPEAATYRPMAFGGNVQAEIEAQGGNAPVIERQFRSSMVEIARRVGLSNEDVHGSIQRRRSLVRSLNTVAAKSEVRAAQNNRELLIYLRKAVAPLNEDLRQLGSSVRPNERPILRGKINSILSEAGRSRPNIAAALKAIQEIYELYAAAKSVKPKNDAEAGLYEQLRLDLEGLETAGFKQRLERTRVLFSSLSPEIAFQSLQSQVNAWADQLSGIAPQPAKAALEKLGKDFTPENYYDAVQKVYAMAAEQYPPAQTGENPAEHALVLQTLGLMPEVLVGFLSLSEFVKNIPANGRAFQFNQTYSVEARRAPGIAPRYLSEPAMIQQEAYRMLAEKWLSAQQSLFSGNRTETLQALDSLSKWLSVGTDGQPWVSQDLVIAPLDNAVEALRSEVRSMSRRKALGILGAALFTPAFAPAEDKGYQGSKASLQSSQRRAEAGTLGGVADEILKIAGDEASTRRERKKNKDFLSNKAITYENGGDFNEVMATDFTWEHAFALAEKGMRPSSFEIHMRWRRLVMDLAADIAITFKPKAGESGKAEPPKLSQEEVEELAVHFQKVTPADILDAASEKPVLTLADIEKMKDDADKVALYRDPNFYLYHYARAKVKIKMSVGDTSFYKGIQSHLDARLMDFVPAGELDEINRLRTSLPTTQVEYQQKREAVRVKVIHDLATVFFEMDRGNRAVPNFNIKDADELARGIFSDPAVTIRDVMKSLANRKSAQRAVEIAAEQLITRIYASAASESGLRRQLFDTVTDVKGGAAAKEQKLLKDLLDFYFQKPEDTQDEANPNRPIINGYIMGVAGAIDFHAKNYARIQTLSGTDRARESARFRNDYAKFVRHISAEATVELTRYNPRVLSESLEMSALRLPIKHRFKPTVEIVTQEQNYPEDVPNGTTLAQESAQKKLYKLMSRPELIDLLEKDIAASKGENIVTLFFHDPGFVNVNAILQPMKFGGFAIINGGMLGQPDHVFEPGLKQRLKKLVEDNKVFFANLPKLLEGRRKANARVASLRSEVRAQFSRRALFEATGAAILTSLGLGFANQATGASPKSKSTPEVDVNPFLLPVGEAPDYTLESMALPAHSLSLAEIESLLTRSKHGERAYGFWSEISRSGRLSAPKKAPIAAVTDIKRLAKNIYDALQLEKSAFELQQIAVEAKEIAAASATANNKVTADLAAIKSQAAQVKAHNAALETLGIPSSQPRTVAGLVRAMELSRIARLSAYMTVRDRANINKPFKTQQPADLSAIAKDLWQLLGEPNLDKVDFEPVFEPFYATDAAQIASAPISIFDMMADSRVRQALYGLTDTEKTLAAGLAKEKVSIDALNPKLPAVNHPEITHTASLRAAVYELFSSLQLKGVETLPEKVFALVPPVTPNDTAYHVGHLGEYFDTALSGKPKSEFKLRHVAAFFASQKLLFASVMHLVIEQAEQLEEANRKGPLARIQPGDLGYFSTVSFFQLNARYYDEIEKLNNAMVSSNLNARQKDEAVAGFHEFLKDYASQSGKLLKEFQDKILALNKLSRSEVRSFRQVAATSALLFGLSLAPDAPAADKPIRVSKANAAAAERRDPEVTKKIAVALFKIADDGDAATRERKKNPDYYSPTAITANGGFFNDGVEVFTMDRARYLAELGVSPKSFESHKNYLRLVMDMSADIAETFRSVVDDEGNPVIRMLTQKEADELAMHVRMLTPEQIIDASFNKPQILTKADYDQMKRDIDKLPLYRNPSFYLYWYFRAMVKVKMTVGDTGFYQGIQDATVLDSALKDYVPTGAAEELKALESEIRTGLKTQADLARRKEEIRVRVIHDLATVLFEMDKANRAVPNFNLEDAGKLAVEEFAAPETTLRTVIQRLAYRKAAQRALELTAEEIVLKMYRAAAADSNVRKALLATKDFMKGPVALRELAIHKDLMGYYFQKPEDTKDESNPNRPKINGDIAYFAGKIEKMAGDYRDGKLSKESYDRFMKEMAASFTRSLSLYNPRLLSEDLELSPLKFPLEKRFSALVEHAAQDLYQLELMVAEPRVVEILKEGLQASGATFGPNVRTLFRHHPQFIDITSILDRRLFPFNVPGIMGNGTVSPAVKSELERMFREPVLTPVGTRKLNHLNKERLGARRSEVRSVGANVQAIVLMAAILMGGVYPSRAPRDVVAAELAKKPIPAVTVTSRPGLKDRVQESLDGLDEVRASLAELATANLPLQVVNDFHDGPKAQDLKTK
ncbi:MAG: hypothetical protein KBC91_02635, partial [Candidatus Omnitrophica bacterium]|nr:hypothetical protein [Candidatus Omnitrophota bacterium]